MKRKPPSKRRGSYRHLFSHSLPLLRLQKQIHSIQSVNVLKVNSLIIVTHYETDRLLGLPFGQPQSVVCFRLSVLAMCVPIKVGCDYYHSLFVHLHPRVC